MAEEPEQRMLFDLRGRRKRVIQVIYVLLALVMVASLIVIGLPGGGIQNTTANVDLAEASIKRAENLENRVNTTPNAVNARAELIRARTSAGNALSEVDQSTGQTTVTPEASEQYDLAAEAWDAYVNKTNGNPDPAVALLMAQTFSTLSTGGTVARFESNSREAVEAQKIVVANAEKLAKNEEGPPPTNQIATLALYQYLAQDTKGAEASQKRALAAVNDDAERRALAAQLKQGKQQGAFIARQLKAAKKQAKQDGGKSLQEPAGNLGAADSLGSGTPAP